MWNTNTYWTFSNVLDEKTCNKIIDIGNNAEWGGGEVETNSKFEVDEAVRKSGVVFTNEQWLYDIIWPYMEKANFNSGWRYNIKYAESMQITKYEKGEFYNFHRDGKSDHLSSYNRPDNGFLHGNNRKLSMTVLLNDDYEGGDFQFAQYSKEKCNVISVEQNKIGSIIVFPSYMEHRIIPITKGLRYSLVVWFVGPPFV
jgi:PKHD-type hydroxylase